MQFHTLKRNTKNKKTRRVGRGGKHAKTSGRGTKGQNARAGHKKRPEIRDFIKRLPKLRGRGKNLNTSIQTKPVAINLDYLNKIFKNGEEVTFASLAKVKMYKSVTAFKILGKGTLDKKLSVKGVFVSASAKTAIEKAGGSVNNS